MKVVARYPASSIIQCPTVSLLVSGSTTVRDLSFPLSLLTRSCERTTRQGTLGHFLDRTTVTAVDTLEKMIRTGSLFVVKQQFYISVLVAAANESEVIKILWLIGQRLQSVGETSSLSTRWVHPTPVRRRRRIVRTA